MPRNAVDAPATDIGPAPGTAPDAAPDVDAVPAPAPGACDCLREGFAALLAAHLQTVADVASLRYEVARLAGAAPTDAAAWACDGTRDLPAAEALKRQGFDAGAFRADLERTLHARAEADAADRGAPAS